MNIAKTPTLLILTTLLVGCRNSEETKSKQNSGPTNSAGSTLAPNYFQHEFTKYIRSAVWLPESRSVAVMLHDSSIELVDMMQGSLKTIAPVADGEEDPNTTFAIRGDLLAVVTPDSSSVELKNWSSGQLVGQARIPTQSPVVAMKISEDYRNVVIACASGIVFLWEPKERAFRSIEKLSTSLHGTISISEDATRVVQTVDFSVIQVLDVATNNVTSSELDWRLRRGLLYSIFVGRNNSILACRTDASALLLNSSTLELEMEIPVHNVVTGCAGLDDTTLALGGSFGEVCVYSKVDAKILWRCQAHKGKVLSVAFADRDRNLFSAGRDHFLKIWPDRTFLSGETELDQKHK